MGKLCKARAQAARTAPWVAFRSLNILSCGRTWRTPGSQWHRSQTVNRWVLPARGSTTSQPALPGIFVTFPEPCVWGQIDRHRSGGSSPSAMAPAQLGQSIMETRKAVSIPLTPSLPCLALQTCHGSRAAGRARGTPPLPITPREDGPGSVLCWEQSWVLGDATRAQIRPKAFFNSQ